MPAGFGTKNCEICKSIIYLKIKRDIERKRFCSRRCLGVWMIKSGTLKFKMTKTIRKKMRQSKLNLLKTGWKPIGWKKFDIPPHFNAHHGYIFKGTKRLHRVLAEQKIGRKLVNGEIVHHVDRNKLNNNLDNLEVMTRSEHMRLHIQERLTYASSIS